MGNALFVNSPQELHILFKLLIDWIEVACLSCESRKFLEKGSEGSAAFDQIGTVIGSTH